MRASRRQVHYPYSEYLILEEISYTKHEFFEGEIYAMAGGTPEHSALASRMQIVIGNQLPPGCLTHTSDLRIRVSTGLSTYPDGAVVCGAVQHTVDDRDAATNPLILVEITSNSTEQYDRGEKLRHYQTIPSLQEILIVSHRERRITIHRRDEHGWSIDEARAGESLQLRSISGVLPVDDVYLNIL
jgi:Uma2 family endonuclease